MMKDAQERAATTTDAQQHTSNDEMRSATTSTPADAAFLQQQQQQQQRHLAHVVQCVQGTLQWKASLRRRGGRRRQRQRQPSAAAAEEEKLLLLSLTNAAAAQDKTLVRAVHAALRQRASQCRPPEGVSDELWTRVVEYCRQQGLGVVLDPTATSNQDAAAAAAAASLTGQDGTGDSLRRRQVKTLTKSRRKRKSFSVKDEEAAEEEKESPLSRNKTTKRRKVAKRIVDVTAASHNNHDNKAKRKHKSRKKKQHHPIETVPWIRFDTKQNVDDRQWLQCVGLTRTRFDALVARCSSRWRLASGDDIIATKKLNIRATFALTLIRLVYPHVSTRALCEGFLLTGTKESVSTFVNAGVSILERVLQPDEQEYRDIYDLLQKYKTACRRDSMELKVLKSESSETNGQEATVKVTGNSKVPSKNHLPRGGRDETIHGSMDDKAECDSTVSSSPQADEITMSPPHQGDGVTDAAKAIACTTKRRSKGIKAASQQRAAPGSSSRRHPIEDTTWTEFDEDQNSTNLQWHQFVGLTRASFDKLVEESTSLWRTNGIEGSDVTNQGHRKLDVRATVALTLIRLVYPHVCRTRIGPGFGVVSACTVTRYFRFGTSILDQIVKAGDEEYKHIYVLLQKRNDAQANLAKKKQGNSVARRGPLEGTSWMLFDKQQKSTDSQWIQSVGLTKSSFDRLVARCVDLWSGTHLGKVSKDVSTRKLDARATVALALIRLQGLLKDHSLHEYFGLGGTAVQQTMSDFSCFGISILNQVIGPHETEYTDLYTLLQKRTDKKNKRSDSWANHVESEGSCSEFETTGTVKNVHHSSLSDSSAETHVEATEALQDASKDRMKKSDFMSSADSLLGPHHLEIERAVESGSTNAPGDIAKASGMNRLGALEVQSSPDRNDPSRCSMDQKAAGCAFQDPTHVQAFFADESAKVHAEDLKRANKDGKKGSDSGGYVASLGLQHQESEEAVESGSANAPVDVTTASGVNLSVELTVKSNPDRNNPSRCFMDQKAVAKSGCALTAPPHVDERIADGHPIEAIPWRQFDNDSKTTDGQWLQYVGLTRASFDKLVARGTNSWWVKAASYVDVRAIFALTLIGLVYPELYKGTLCAGFGLSSAYEVTVHRRFGFSILVQIVQPNDEEFKGIYSLLHHGPTQHSISAEVGPSTRHGTHPSSPGLGPTPWLSDQPPAWDQATGLGNQPRILEPPTDFRTKTPNVEPMPRIRKPDPWNAAPECGPNLLHWRTHPPAWGPGPGYWPHLQPWWTPPRVVGPKSGPGPDPQLGAQLPASHGAPRVVSPSSDEQKHRSCPALLQTRTEQQEESAASRPKYVQSVGTRTTSTTDKMTSSAEGGSSVAAPDDEKSAGVHAEKTTALEDANNATTSRNAPADQDNIVLMKTGEASQELSPLNNERAMVSKLQETAVNVTEGHATRSVGANSPILNNAATHCLVGKTTTMTSACAPPAVHPVDAVSTSLETHQLPAASELDSRKAPVETKERCEDNVHDKSRIQSNGAGSEVVHSAAASSALDSATGCPSKNGKRDSASTGKWKVMAPWNSTEERSGSVSTNDASGCAGPFGLTSKPLGDTAGSNRQCPIS